MRSCTGKTNVQRQRRALSRRGRSQPCDQVSEEAITAAAKRAVVAWSLVSFHTVPKFIACQSQSPCTIQTWSETRWHCRLSSDGSVGMTATLSRASLSFRALLFHVLYAWAGWMSTTHSTPTHVSGEACRTHLVFWGTYQANTF